MILLTTHEFGEFLKKVRIQHGYKTQKMFSEVSGISQTTLSRIEAGAQRPLPETLMVMSEHLRPYTYGELMEKAGYFEGLPNEDKSFVMDLFNETEHIELEHKIYKLIDSLAVNNKFPDNVISTLKTEFDSLFISEGWDDVEYVPSEIKQLVKELDSNFELKQTIYKGLILTKNLLSKNEIFDIHNNNLNKIEQNLITKYRKLDDIGKYTVDTTLDAQYKRCTESTHELRAAHIDDNSVEQTTLLQQDLDDL